MARNYSQTKLNAGWQKDFLNRYDSLTDCAEEAVPGLPSPKAAGLTAHNLLNRFVKSKAKVVNFMTDFKVPYD